MKDELEAKVVYVRDAPTKSESRRYSLDPGDEIRFPARNAPFHRKIAVITNRDPSGNGNAIQIRLGTENNNAQPAQDQLAGSNGGPIGGTLFARQMIGFPTSDAIYIKNANASGTCIVDMCEIFYT